MMIVLPLFVFCALAYHVHTRLAVPLRSDVRESLLHAVLYWAILLLIITEFASAFHALHRTGLCTGWALAACGVSAALFFCKPLAAREQAAPVFRFPSAIADRILVC
ncbi:MAG: hypothetical protein JXA71_11220, partial [Chitinispirillaceae bacterium]|nr:hypothetical protein [Chitinispirillaceae bacterium]